MYPDAYFRYPLLSWAPKLGWDFYHVFITTVLVFFLWRWHLLDASLLNIGQCMDIAAALLDVKNIAGDADLGGSDFNNTMVSHFVRGFIRKHKKIGIKTHKMQEWSWFLLPPPPPSSSSLLTQSPVILFSSTPPDSPFLSTQTSNLQKVVLPFSDGWKCNLSF